MTLAKSSYRKRRKSSLNGIPRNIREWFAGERRFTFFAYSHPYRAHMREYWQSWLAENPNAVMPAGLEYMLKSPACPPQFDEECDED